jgi:hypothetical protein
MDTSVFHSQPVSIMASIRAGKPVAMIDVDNEQQLKDRHDFLEAFTVGLESKADELRRFVSACLFCYSREHYERVAYLHNVLDKAVIDIVERWYSDEKASFPARMPLRDNEDKLLRVSHPTPCWTLLGLPNTNVLTTLALRQWIYGPGRAVVAPFKGRQGNWRPDYLLEKVVLPDGSVTENIKLCEINARMPWNGFVMVPHAAGVFEQLGISKAGMKPGMSSVCINSIPDVNRPQFANEKSRMRSKDFSNSLTLRSRFTL